jgi:hypothetical protein
LQAYYFSNTYTFLPEANRNSPRKKLVETLASQKNPYYVCTHVTQKHLPIPSENPKMNSVPEKLYYT